MSIRFTRRQLGYAGLAGAAGLALARHPLRALAAPTKPKKAIVLVFLGGGQNQIFSSADSHLAKGHFGVTSSNIRDLGNGVFIDSAFAAGLGTEATSRLGVFGVAHGQSGHEGGQASFWMDSAPSKLAHLMGGDGALRLVRTGPNAPMATIFPYESANIEVVSDLEPMIAAVSTLGGDEPDRSVMASLTGAQAEAFRQHQRLDQSTADGIASNFETLGKVLALPSSESGGLAAIPAAYGLQGTVVNTMTEQLAAAEMSVRLGANVVIVHDQTLIWDFHADLDASAMRARMAERLMPGLRTFLDRTLLDPTLDVSVALVSEFNRSLPGSDHATVLSAPVIGRSVRVATTGRLDERVGLPDGSPSHDGMWSLFAELGGAVQNPFGPNPHKALLLG